MKPRQLGDSDWHDQDYAIICIGAVAIEAVPIPAVWGCSDEHLCAGR